MSGLIQRLLLCLLATASLFAIAHLASEVNSTTESNTSPPATGQPIALSLELRSTTNLKEIQVFINGTEFSLEKSPIDGTWLGQIDLTATDRLSLDVDAIQLQKNSDKPFAIHISARTLHRKWQDTLWGNKSIVESCDISSLADPITNP